MTTIYLIGLPITFVTLVLYTVYTEDNPGVVIFALPLIFFISILWPLFVAWLLLLLYLWARYNPYT